MKVCVVDLPSPTARMLFSFTALSFTARSFAARSFTATPSLHRSLLHRSPSLANPSSNAPSLPAPSPHAPSPHLPNGSGLNYVGSAVQRVSSAISGGDEAELGGDEGDHRVRAAVGYVKGAVAPVLEDLSLTLRFSLTPRYKVLQLTGGAAEPPAPLALLGLQQAMQPLGVSITMATLESMSTRSLLCAYSGLASTMPRRPEPKASLPQIYL